MRYLGYFLMGFVFGLIAIMVVHSAKSQEEQHSHDGVVGKFYSTWMKPDNRAQSCCSDRDCYNTSTRRANGQWQFFSHFYQDWVVLPERLLEHNQSDPRESPDGMSHVCENPTYGTLYCAVLGGLY